MINDYSTSTHSLQITCNSSGVKKHLLRRSKVVNDLLIRKASAIAAAPSASIQSPKHDHTICMNISNEDPNTSRTQIAMINDYSTSTHSLQITYNSSGFPIY